MRGEEIGYRAAPASKFIRHQKFNLLTPEYSKSLKFKRTMKSKYNKTSPNDYKCPIDITIDRLNRCGS